MFMSGKKKRKPNRRSGRRTNFGRIVTAVICTAAICAAIVCVFAFGRNRIVGDGESGQTMDEVRLDDRQDVQEETIDVKEQRAPEGAAEDSSSGDAQETDQDAVSKSDSVSGQEGESENVPGKEEITVSIMGDSISTFQGYIPAGYYDFFPENGLVSDVNDTWWKRVLDEEGWTLCVNGSSSGATCVGDSTSMDNPQCSCNEFRTGGLSGSDGTAPDIIIVYMGTNDFLQSIPLGDNDGTRAVAEGQVAMFGDAYTLMLDKLRVKYPASQIYCCTITQVGGYGTDTPYVEMVNGVGLTTADYSARIAQIAGNKNLPVIDLQGCGIAVENLHNTTADGVHPTPEGMQYIAEAVRKVLN